MKRFFKFSKVQLFYLSLILILVSCQSDNKIENNSIYKFQKQLIEDETTGSNVAMVFKDDKIIYKEVVNSEKKGDKNINDETIFPVWSMSKPITTVAMMTLFEDGLIDFNDNVSDYIPSFKNIKCKGKVDQIYECENSLKIIHLMTHRSGYKYYNWKIYRLQPDEAMGRFISHEKYDNLEDFVEDVANEPLEYEPGTQYVYGINQAILGRIVEVVTKKSFYEYLKERIFDPLDMMNTKFYLTSEDRNKFQPLYLNSMSTKEYTNSYDELHYEINNHAYFGGEGLVSTLEDYAKFCKMLLNGGELKGQRIISKNSIDIMTEKHSDGNDGFYNAFSLFVLEDPLEDGRNSSKGIYGWSGYHNTHFWIDNEKNLFGLFMTRAREYSQDIQNDFREAVYSIY
ncbi:MAG: beta-lactamase family protein [Cryomorphaceae bacterium]|jgi:CubicO group peptidase (beta-lactamase class C family)|nr:beta-lactamase family protein [Cryomorphaceae bacterium]MBT6729516.1 beta-lactamase family protein [Cryomorphaceae bacterium]MBT7881281.1 beta-lactamase family protein [Flavobacteriaceae bacterium]